VPPSPSAAGFIDSSVSSDVLRTVADGRTSFLVRGKGVTTALSIDPAWGGTELTLADQAKRTGATMVQRLASGRIRLFFNDRIYSDDGGIWLARPTAFAYHEKVAKTVDGELQDVARSILDMCVHTLSPAGHGATLVWFPSGRTSREKFLDFSVQIIPPALSAAEASHDRQWHTRSVSSTEQQLSTLMAAFWP
jgi:hypothetical protein